ncbi:MAG: decarboxylating NADP(+)-dependent phosphogluconate dehydrogenase [Chlamydiales bacterium]|nr:decarboxylating NADP(+)-dependent phosphogluconate dehydrogenase [Chlamydiales bacterium]NCF70916.1 decarboxylating NADP(+)-dependent phosphogluconate dehydrogenase [Chlamydiales bacterium]
MKASDIGLIGLAVMGQNLVLNFQEKGYDVAVFNRSSEKTKLFEESCQFPDKLQPFYELEAFVRNLKRPRKIILMVKAGFAVDEFIEKVTPFLEKGDILIDGGNSHYEDTQRRQDYLLNKGLSYLGVGISGGEEGARHGPSIMAGGDSSAWKEVAPMFDKIAAQVDDIACSAYLGEGGAGHYVKMVHNGIEYADMQLIAEVYDFFKRGLNYKNQDIAAIFSEWNTKELDSFLIDITSQILRVPDQEKTGDLIDQILDCAAQKGTGKWTVQGSLDMSMPVSLISEAVFSRFLSSIKEERVFASQKLIGPSKDYLGQNTSMEKYLFQALYAAKIVSYAQGFMLLRKASMLFDWKLPLAQVALIWRGGCIIKSQFLNMIANAYKSDEEQINILFDKYFLNEMQKLQTGWRKVVSTAAEIGIPIPAISAALAFYDGYRSEVLPANLIQAQRDFFGAHTYERCDKKRGEFFHTQWLQEGV